MGRGLSSRQPTGRIATVCPMMARSRGCESRETKVKILAIAAHEFGSLTFRVRIKEAIAVLLLLVMLASWAHAQRASPQAPRIGLIIANFNYISSKDKLSGPLHD